MLQQVLRTKMECEDVADRKREKLGCNRCSSCTNITKKFYYLPLPPYITLHQVCTYVPSQKIKERHNFFLRFMSSSNNNTKLYHIYVTTNNNILGLVEPILPKSEMSMPQFGAKLSSQ